MPRNHFQLEPAQIVAIEIPGYDAAQVTLAQQRKRAERQARLHRQAQRSKQQAKAAARKRDAAIDADLAALNAALSGPQGQTPPPERKPAKVGKPTAMRVPMVANVNQPTMAGPACDEHVCRMFDPQ